MIFKTTILKSNPQIIRVFEMKAEHTLKDLISTVCCIHGWDRGTKLFVYKDSVKMPESEQIGDCFQADTPPELWKIQYGSGMNVWMLRLEVVSVEESTEEQTGLPRLIRFRGLNPILNTEVISNWNIIAKELLKNGRYYDYRKGFLSVSDYEPRLAVINKQLCKNVKKGAEEVKTDIKIEWSNARLFRNIAKGYTLEKLKTIIRDNGLPVTYNQKKAYVLEDLLDYFEECDTIWEDILEEMPMGEYEGFKQYISQGMTSGQCGFETLVSYGVLAPNYVGVDMPIAKELLSCYEYMMMSTGDREMVLRKKVSEVFECARKLYGFFPKKIALQLGQEMYPEDFTSELLEEYWYNREKLHLLKDSAVMSRVGREERDYMDMMYDFHDFTAEEVLDYLRVMSQVEVEYYIPKREEAIRYAREEQTFRAKEQKKLQDALVPLKKYRYMSDYSIMKDIYRMCHLNYTVRRMVERVKRLYYLSGSEAEFQKLIEVISDCKKNIRQVMLFGYTETEAKELWHIELKEG